MSQELMARSAVHAIAVQGRPSARSSSLALRLLQGTSRGTLPDAVKVLA
jgi:hypothetical protein